MTSCKKLIAISLVWVTSSLISLTQLWLPLVVIDVIVCLIIFSGFICIAGIYIYIGCKVTERKTSAKFNATQVRQRTRENKQTLSICFLSASTYFTCVFPYVFANLYYDIKGLSWDRKVAEVIYMLFTIKCTLDPTLYIFAKQIMTLIRKKIYTPGQEIKLSQNVEKSNQMSDIVMKKVTYVETVPLSIFCSDTWP